LRFAQNNERDKDCLQFSIARKPTTKFNHVSADIGLPGAEEADGKALHEQSWFPNRKRYYFTSTPEGLESKQPEISKAALTQRNRVFRKISWFLLIMQTRRLEL